MANGTVKWFNGTKGFGFIQPDDGGQDVFVHISAVERAGMRDLRDGQKISYELVQDKRSGKMSADTFVFSACRPVCAARPIPIGLALVATVARRLWPCWPPT